MILQHILVRNTSVPTGSRLLSEYSVNDTMVTALHAVDSGGTCTLFMSITIRGVIVKVYQFAMVYSTVGGLNYNYGNTPDILAVMVQMYDHLCEAAYVADSPVLVLWAGLGDYYLNSLALLSVDMWENDQMDKLSEEDDYAGTINFGAPTSLTASIEDDVSLDDIWLNVLGDDDDDE